MEVKLDEIPGIGKKLKTRILEFFENDEREAIRALKNGMVGIIPGISSKQAIKIAQTIFEMEYNEKVDSTLKTEHAKEIYNDIIDIISKYFITDYARNKISLYFPLSAKNLNLIKQRNQIFKRAIEFVKKYNTVLQKRGIFKYLKNLSMLKRRSLNLKIKNRHIVTNLEDVMNRLNELEITKYVSCEQIDLEKIENIEAFFNELSDEYDCIIYISNNFSELPDLPNIIAVDPTEISESLLIPELIISYFASNSIIINAIYNIGKMLMEIPDKHLVDDFIKVIDLKKIEQLQKNTQILDKNGMIKKGIDKQLDKYLQDAGEFTGRIIEIENWINTSIKNSLKKSEITIHGEKILDFFRSDFSMDNIRQYIPDEIEHIMEDIINEGIEMLKDKFHIPKNDKIWLEELYPAIIEVPISLNYEGVNKLQLLVQKRAAIYTFNKIKNIAYNLVGFQNYLNEITWTMFEFDFFYAIGRFALDYKLNIPGIVEDKRGITFLDSYNLYLMRDTLERGIKTIPITYTIGNIPLNNVKQSRLNLLSGSNSGGKTMCLFTIAHNIMLAQMGLPTPGKVKYYPFSEIYFFKKSSGQLSAGAFESTLLMFVNLAQSPKEKLILADELEAITEPNAAAKVMSALFSLLLNNPNNYAVFVTHLIDLLLANLTDDEKALIRIDGIESKGLNENLELIVDRSPKFNFIAKSTPEFILERLSKQGDQAQRSFFSQILKKFHST
ncbi:MAG: hypothetical protein ACTSRZ_11575 [Promethearchaeota archaeon]